MNNQSDWTYPEPRKGIAGQWDKFVGPGATAAEQALALIPATFASLALISYAIAEDLGWSIPQYIVAALLAFDIVGGVATNATSSAKRWYHRKGQTRAKHLIFIAIHVFHIFLVSWLFRNLDIVYIISVYCYLMISSFIIVFCPLRIQRSVALLLTCGAIILSEYILSPTPGFEWFIPFLFIKLLVSHLTMEEPYL